MTHIPPNPTDGRLLVDAFDDVFGTETPIHTVDSTFIDGQLLACRVRQVLNNDYCPSLGWLRCMHSRDFQFASLEIYNNQHDASEQHALSSSPKMIMAVWFEPRRYYMPYGCYKCIFFDNRIDEKGEAANARLLRQLMPFDIRKRIITK